MAAPDVNLRTGLIQATKVVAAHIAAAAVTTAKLATKAVTGVKIDEAAFKFLVFTGHDDVGACTLTGAKVGDKVIGVVDLTNLASVNASFETTITVADQIQQSDEDDLSAVKHAVILLVKS